MRWLARAGLAARGVMYVMIGWIAVQVAFGRSRQQADRTGALHSISATPVGGVLLWLLVIGFIGMALWRLSEAAVRLSGLRRQKTSKRLAAFARAIIYGVIAYGVLKYALGLGSPQSSDTQSVDLTATLLKYPGGQALVVVIGLAFIGGGLYLAYKAWRKEVPPRPGARADADPHPARRGMARPVRRDRPRHRVPDRGHLPRHRGRRRQPQQAKGVDSSLRRLAVTPLGPWLLVLVAIGLVMFGLFSCCQAKWTRL